MTKVMCLGDLHLGGSLSLGKIGLGSQLNSRILDRLSILDWLLQQAIEKQVSDIVLTGDEFEEMRPSPNLITLFVDWLRHCSDNGINVHLVMGNHSLFRSGQHNICALDIVAAAEIQGVFIYKDITSLDLSGISLTFIPFRDRRSFNTNSNTEALQILSNRIKFEVLGLDKRNIKVAIGHLALVGSLPESNEIIDNMANEIFCPLEMFQNYNYTLMGHVHKFQILQEHPFIAHIGSADISNFGEAKQNKFVAFIDPDNEKIIQFIDVPCRPLQSINISVPANMTDTTNYVLLKLKEQNLDLQKAIIKLHIFLESQDLMNADKNIIEKYLTSKGAFYVPRIDQERKISQIKKHTGNEQIDNTITEISAIKLYANSNIENKILDDFIALAHNIVKETNASN